MKVLVIIFLFFTILYVKGDRRIFGGIQIKPAFTPYQAVLLYRPFYTFKYWCGGSFLSEKVVLSAAHCTDNGDADDYKVSGGGHYFESDSTKFDVEKIINHEKYKTYENDISVLILRSVRNFPKTISFVKLVKKDFEPKVGEKMIVTGYGKTENSADANKKFKKAHVPIYDQKTCQKNYEIAEEKVTSKMICAGYKDGVIDTCSGDSGGPMVHAETKELVGITSWGDGCALKNRPGIYTRVSKYIDWIDNVIAKNI